MTLPVARQEIRSDLLALGAGAALLFTILLGARDLWNPNEPLYGQAIAEMAERGDWLVPTVNGQVFDEKPILYFWLALAAAQVGGAVNEFTLRLPSALSGVVAVLLSYVLVHPYAGRLRARLAAVLFATTFVVFWSARSVQMDLLLCACALGAVVAAVRTLDHGLSAPWGWSLAGAATGLAVLAKGPVGLVAAGLPVLLYVASTRRVTELLRPATVLGVATLTLVAAPWFLLLWAHGETSFLGEVLYRQNVVRFREAWDHQAPWWYYLAYFWIDMAPWSFFVPLAWGLPGWDEAERKLDLLAWLWIAALIGFFSLSASKRSPYILPAAPAVAVLVSGVAERWVCGRLSGWRLRASLSVSAALGLLLLGAGVYLQLRVLPRYTLLEPFGQGVSALLMLGGLLVVAAALARRTRLASPLALFSLVVTLYLWAAVAVLPRVDAYKSSRSFCEAVNARVAWDHPLSAYRPWKWRAGYSYYTGRRIPRLSSIEELSSYWAREEPVFLIVERGELGEARTVLGDAEPLLAAPVGANFAYLFTNQVGPRGASGGNPPVQQERAAEQEQAHGQ